MPYWRLHYHIVWATRGRQPKLDGVVREVVAREIEAVLKEHGVRLHAMFLMPDHVHLAASIPPTVLISTMIGRLKGASSHAANLAITGSDRPPFAWQGEYGIVSVGEQALPMVAAYVRDQPRRHAADDLYAALERVADAADSGSHPRRRATKSSAP